MGLQAIEKLELWATPHSPLKTAVMHLVKTDVPSMFVVDILDLWVKSEAPYHGWKTGGKHCKTEIINPVLTWWMRPEGSIDGVVNKKYLPPAMALAEKLDEVAWTLFGEVRCLNVDSD